VDEVTKATPKSDSVVPLTTELQVPPPSDVRRIVPESPTTMPKRLFVKEIALSAEVVPEVCETHEYPPSVVSRMTPSSPTVQPVQLLAKWTAWSQEDTPLVSGVHVDPASTVFRIVPELPTTQPVEGSLNSIPWSNGACETAGATLQDEWSDADPVSPPPPPHPTASNEKDAIIAVIGILLMALLLSGAFKADLLPSLRSAEMRGKRGEASKNVEGRPFS
jgi:hypothetical protein